MLVTREPGGERELPRDPEALGLAALCLLLPLVPARGNTGGARVGLRTRSSAETVGLELSVEPAAGPRDEDATDAARSLVAGCGGRVVVHREHGEDAPFAAELTVPRATIG